MESLLKGFQRVFHKDLELSWWENVREERGHALLVLLVMKQFLFL